MSSTPADARVVTRIRRSPVLRAMAASGITGAMQAALIADIHPVASAGIPLGHNPLTWNPARATWDTANYWTAAADEHAAADVDGVRERLLADV